MTTTNPSETFFGGSNRMGVLKNDQPASVGRFSTVGLGGGSIGPGFGMDLTNLVGGLVAINLAFSQKYWVAFLIPIDEVHHFSEGWRKTTNQKNIGLMGI